MGNEQAVIDQQPSALDWRQHIPEDVKADQSLAPIIEKIQEKDIPSVVKSFIHAQKRLGSAINFPGKDAKPEEVTAFKGKLLESGYIPRVPESPDKYEIAKPEKLSAGVAWNDDIANDFKATAHKLGLTNDQANALVGYHAELMGKMQGQLMATVEAGNAKLKEKWGAEYDSKLAAAQRAAKQIFSQEQLDFIDRTGMGNDAQFNEIMAAVGANIAPDSSYVEDQGKPTASATGEAARLEHIDIMTNPNNPRHKLYQADDPATIEYVDQLYKKAYPEMKING